MSVQLNILGVNQKVNLFTLFTISFAIALSFSPLLFNLPFRDNIYLSYEGAFRISEGQIPFKDFYMPFGYGYFIPLALFFLVFGPYLKTLLLAQAVINLILLLVFNRLLRVLDIKSEIAFLSTFVMGLSYTFLFFWPWYNHLAFFYNLLALYFCVVAILTPGKQIINSMLAGVFAFLAFFTKQDYGGLSILSLFFLFLVGLYLDKDYKKTLFFISGIVLATIIFLVPVYGPEFKYWFNLGQPPHQSRLNVIDFLNEIFAGSEWEKFGLLIIVIVALNNLESIFKDKRRLILFLVVLIIVAETLITKVTSRLPKDTTTYFWGFFFAFLFHEVFRQINFKKFYLFGASILFIFFLFSAKYWSYANRILKIKSSGKNSTAPSYAWKPTPFKSFSNVYLPEPTSQGIETILDLKLPENPSVLNMSELTMLSNEIPYSPLKNVPLWYHLNIGIFDKQVNLLKEDIAAKEYDLVLFENVPNLDNFYPFELEKSLINNYKIVTKFPAPRKDSTSVITVYVKE